MKDRADKCSRKRAGNAGEQRLYRIGRGVGIGGIWWDRGGNRWDQVFLQWVEVCLE